MNYRMPFILCTVAPLFAQTAGRESVVPAGFVAGMELKHLAGLGVPDLTGAKWVSGEPGIFNQLVYGRPGVQREIPEVLEILGPVSMHGWMVDTKADGAPLVMLPGNPEVFDPRECSPMVFDGDAKRVREMRAQLLAGVKALPVANLSVDLDGVISRLEKKAGELHKRQSAAYGQESYLDKQESAIAGRMFVFAAQILRAGDPESAKRLATAVSKIFPRHESALNAAGTVIAETRYRMACDAFAKSGDWAGYAGSLKSLEKDFPRGWANRAAIAKLRALVEKRASGRVPEISLPAGVQGDAGTLAAFAKLGELNETPSGVVESYGAVSPSSWPWLLPASGKKNPRGMNYAGMAFDSVPNTPEVQTLTKAGFAALPVFVAALGDETLTPYFRRIQFNSGFFAPGESAEAQAWRLFDALRRPMTRGEISRALLVRILPGEDNRFNNMDAETLAETVETFRRQNSGLTPVELAWLYFKQGSGRQRYAALSYFGESEDPSVAKVFEDSLLASPDLEWRVGDGIEYVRIRRGKASELAKKLVAKLKGNIAQDNGRPKNSYSTAKQNGVTRIDVQQLERLIRELEVYARGGSVRETLLGIASRPAVEAKPMLFKQWEDLDGMSLAERVPLLVEVACSAPDPEVKSWLIGQISMRGVPRDGASGGKYTAPAPGSVDAKRWMVLIDDKSKDRQGGVIGQAAAWKLESLFDPPPSLGMNFEDRAKLDDLILRRAKARLQGREIPAYPDIRKVSAERLKAIITGISVTPDEKIADFISGLNEDERAAWGVWWNFHLWPRSPGGAGVGLPDVAAPEAMLVREKRLSTFVGKLPGDAMFSAEDRTFALNMMTDLGLKTGDIVDAARVMTLCISLSRDIEKYSGSFFNIGHFGPSIGLSYNGHREKIKPMDKSARQDFRMLSPRDMFALQLQQCAMSFKVEGEHGFKGADGVVILRIHGPADRLDGIWRVKGGKVEGPSTLDAEFGKSIPVTVQIIVLSAADAKSILGEG